MEITKKLLEKEIKIFTEARDGINKAWQLIKKNENREDEYLRDIYYQWDTKIKDYKNALEILQKESNLYCVKLKTIKTDCTDLQKLNN